MIILLLSGWSGSGKDAIATLLQAQFGFQRLAFADPLKMIVAREYTLPLSMLHSQEGKATRLSNGETVREVLIRRGQQIRAEVNDPGYFANCIANLIINDDTAPTGYVISDWRLSVEYETLRMKLEQYPYTFIKVRVSRTGQHESPVQDSLTEHQLDSYIFDIHIENPGTTFEALQSELDKKLTPCLTSSFKCTH